MLAMVASYSIVPVLQLRGNIMNSSLMPNFKRRPDSIAMTTDQTTADDRRQWFRAASFVFLGLNFALCIILSLFLAFKGITDDEGTRLATYRKTSILAQTNSTQLTGTPSETPDFFTKVLMGVQGHPNEIMHKITDDKGEIIEEYKHHFDKYPRLWQFSKSSSQFTMTTIHSQFLLFVALWIASAYSVCVVRLSVFPTANDWFNNNARIGIVSAWNLLGIVFIVVMFSNEKAGHWGEVPVSNFLAGFIFVLISWVYQLGYLNEADQATSAAEDLNVPALDRTEVNEFTWVRRIIYLEMATTMPLLVVAAITPGADGIEQWRIQVTLFSIYLFFSILGLLERWKSLGYEIADINSKLAVIDPVGSAQRLDGENDLSKMTENDMMQAYKTRVNMTRDTHDKAVWFLAYGAFMCYVCVLNAIGFDLFQNVATSYFTYEIKLARVCCVLLFVLMALIICIVFVYYGWHMASNVNMLESVAAAEKVMRWESSFFHAELMLIFACSLKIIFFTALENPHRLMDAPIANY
jgi:hypothetical protein